MASASTRRVADTFFSIATQLRAISISAPGIPNSASGITKSVSGISQSLHNNIAAALKVDFVPVGPLLPSSAAAVAVAGANPKISGICGLGEILSPRRVISSRELGSSRVEFKSGGFASRLHGWGGSANVSSFIGRGLKVGVGQQVRTIFVEVKGNNLERGIRKWRRKCKEENLKALKEREYFKKPSEKRVLALKERDRRIARRSFKMKLNWILGRRQRGF